MSDPRVPRVSWREEPLLFERSRAGRIEMSSPIQTVSIPSRRSPRPRTPAGADAGQVWGGSRGGEVILYGTTWCGACRKASAHLDERGVDYVSKDIEDDPEAHEEYLEKSGGRRGVPLIDVGGEIMPGYSSQRLDQLLEKMG